MELSSTIGTLLPLAAGIAISPVPIIAVILILVTPRAVSSGLGFLTGWVLGIGALTTVASLLVGSVSEGGTGPRPVVAVINIVLGLALVALSLREGRRARTQPDDGALPPWLGRVDRLSTMSAALLGTSLSALNPKNVVLCLSAGAVVGGAAAQGVSRPIAISVFTVVASLWVAVPVLGRLVAGQRLAPVLDRVRAWLTVNNRAIMFVLALVIGLVLIGQGLGEF